MNSSFSLKSKLNFPIALGSILCFSCLISPVLAGKNKQTYDGGTSTINCTNAYNKVTEPLKSLTRVFYTLQTVPGKPDIAYVNLVANFDSAQNIPQSTLIVPPKAYVEGRIERPERWSSSVTFGGTAYGLGVIADIPIIRTYVIPPLPADCSVPY